MPLPEDTTNIDKSSWITDEFLADILKNKHSNQDGISIIRKDIKRAVGKAENYLSVLYRVKVEYKRGENDESESSHFIIKAVPLSEYVEKLVHQTGVFVRELTMYHTVLPEFYKFAEGRMKAGAIPPLTGGCYKTRRNNTLVLEDLTHQGYHMADRKKRLDLNHCQLVLKSLAKLHGVSAVLHQNNPDVISKYGEIMWCQENIELVGMFIPPLIKNIAEVCKNWEGCVNISAKITRILPSILDKFFEEAKLQEGGFNVLTHGDCWINNMMFKYSANGDPIDMRFLDLQLSRLASPALDLSYFIYSSPQNEVRFEHMEELLQGYHTHLSDTMRDLGGNGEVFTFKDLKDELKRTAFFGFVASIITLQVLLVKADEVFDFEEFKEEDVKEEGVIFFEKTHSSSLFREALQPLLSYFDELGVFD